MKKDFRDSDEFKFFEQHYDEMMEEFENDSLDYRLPEEWDKRFRKIISETIRKEERKGKIRKCMKVLGLATAAMLVIIISVQSVQGRSFKKFFQDLFDFGKDNYIVYGTGEMEFIDSDNPMVFNADTLGELYTRIGDELKIPLFYFEDVFENYEIKEAEYDINFHTINVELKLSDGHAYIFQDNSYDNEVMGMTTDEELCATVKNESLNTDIMIYKSKSDDGYLFTIKEGQSAFFFAGNIPLTDCCKLAESIYYE